MTPACCPKCGSPWFKLKVESHSRPARFISKPNTRVDIFLELYYRCDVCHWEWWEFPHEPAATTDEQPKEQNHA